jgi:hypothetical protein
MMYLVSRRYGIQTLRRLSKAALLAIRLCSLAEDLTLRPACIIIGLDTIPRELVDSCSRTLLAIAPGASLNVFETPVAQFTMEGILDSGDYLFDFSASMTKGEWRFEKWVE